MTEDHWHRHQRIQKTNERLLTAITLSVSLLVIMLVVFTK